LWSRDTLLKRFGSVPFKTGKTVMTLAQYFRYAQQTKEETPL
jgi:hypothetical protein